MALSSSLVAMKIAHRNGTLRIKTRNGRFGEFVAICDDRGTIEVADTMAEAQALVGAL